MVCFLYRLDAWGICLQDYLIYTARSMRPVGSKMDYALQVIDGLSILEWIGIAINVAFYVGMSIVLGRFVYRQWERRLKEDA